MMKKHCFLFLAAMMVCSMANAATSPWANITVAKAKVAPTIDGTINDGEYLTTCPVVMNNANMAQWGGKMDGETGDKDLSGTYLFTWDATYLYVAVRVNDQSILNKANQGQGLNGTDVAQLCLDPQYLKGGDINSTTTGLRIIDVTPGQKDHPSKAAIWQHWPTINNVEAGYPATFPNTKIASRVVGLGYELEFAIKWTDMTPNAPTPAIGKKIGYLALLMDHDPVVAPATETRKDLWWNHAGTAAIIGDASQWNTITLGAEINPFVTSVASKAATAPVIDGNINLGAGEWQTAPIQMDAATMAAFDGSMNHLISTTLPGAPAGTQATHYLMWDNTNLYWAARVIDPKVVYLLPKGGALNATDGVQLCLDPLYTRSDAKAMTDGAFGEVIVDLVPGNSDVTPMKADLFVHGPAAATPAYANAKFASRLIPGGYEVEASMKWSDMATTAVTPVLGGKIGYMTMLMQFDTAGQQDLWWNAGKNTIMIGNASQWNTAILGDVATPVTLVPVEMSNFNVE